MSNFATQEEMDLIVGQAQMLAMLPIRKWLDALDHAETLAPILDPTLYRSYIYSKNPDRIKKILRACWQFSEAVKEAQVEAVEDALAAAGR